MNSPGLRMRNTSTTLLEPTNTPIAFGKYDHSKATPMPGSPSFNGPVGSTPHTSTPVAPCKSAQESLPLSHNVTLTGSCREDCMPFSSLTPANFDYTVNYAITNGPTSPNSLATGQSPCTIPTLIQSQKASQSQQLPGPSMHAKDGATGHSSIGLSHLHNMFHYPGDTIAKKSDSHDESAVSAQTELAMEVQQKETSPVICIEESPPNSQGINLNDINDVKSDGDELLLSSKATSPQSVAKHTSQKSVPKTASNTPNLRAVDSERAESPLLFDTPGCLGGPQSLAAKLSKIVNSSNQPTSDHSNSKADFDDDRTPPISPDDQTTENGCPRMDSEQKVMDGQKDKKNTNLSYAEMETDDDGADKHSMSKRGASRKQHERSSDLGQPRTRTRRMNTRMAKRKSTAENDVCGSSSKCTVNKSVENDEDDFVPDKRTPRKQSTVAEPMKLQVHVWWPKYLDILEC